MVKIILIMENSQSAIVRVCDEVKEMLLEKNRKYGDSAFNPVRMFSKSDKKEQIRVRIDDKLSRIARSKSTEEDEDVIMDLIGYLIIYKAVDYEEAGSVIVR